jgi:hypothetical protein
MATRRHGQGTSVGGQTDASETKDGAMYKEEV